MRSLAWSLIIAISPVASVGLAGAQDITRDSYYHMVPPRPRIVGQTKASAAFHLFGDLAGAAYRDVDPPDGIDDGRAVRLMQLAERFSPIIRPNNFSVPRDPRDVIGTSPMLHVDRWENGIRVASESVHFAAAVTLAGEVSRSASSRESTHQALRDLLARHGPRAGPSDIADPEMDRQEVLFFDLPGTEPRSWAVNARSLRSTPTIIFAHPFVHEDPNAATERRYLLVIQYWLFFTFNNSVNNHEGDWEHINVQITTRSGARRTSGRVDASLSRVEIESLLDSSSNLESTVVAAVEYHFHHLVMTLDYLNRDVLPVAGATSHRHETPRVWEDRDHLARAIDQRITVAGGKLATHPFVFVGGNYKGPIELLDVVPRFTASHRRNSHGAYPFPGTWQAVGPLGYTEQVHGHVVPPLRSDTSISWDSLIADPDYLTYRAANIVLLPDWERLEPLVAGSDAALLRWGWMLLPLHWGFPASPSIGAGAIRHVDMGNLAPHSPPYKAQWNRVGLSLDRQRYDPRVLRTPVSPTTPWALLRSGWGILNAPLAMWGLLPGYNVVMHEMMPWVAGTMHTLGVPPPRTYTAVRLPHRITTAGHGAFWEFGGDDFARLLPFDSTAGSDLLRRDIQPGARLGLSLFFHDRFALENSYSEHTSTISRGSSRARLDQKQLTSGVRFTPRGFSGFDESLQLYMRAGYGWLWLRTRGALHADTAIAGIREGRFPALFFSRSWWPSTWYVGAGAEAFAPPRAWLLGRLGYGVRVESAVYYHRIGANQAGRRGRIDARRGDVAASIVFGW